MFRIRQGFRVWGAHAFFKGLGAYGFGAFAIQRLRVQGV